MKLGAVGHPLLSYNNFQKDKEWLWRILGVLCQGNKKFYEKDILMQIINKLGLSFYILCT